MKFLFGLFLGFFVYALRRVLGRKHGGGERTVFFGMRNIVPHAVSSAARLHACMYDRMLEWCVGG